MYVAVNLGIKRGNARSQVVHTQKWFIVLIARAHARAYKPAALLIELAVICEIIRSPVLIILFHCFGKRRDSRMSFQMVKHSESTTAEEMGELNRQARLLKHGHVAAQIERANRKR